MTTETVVIVMMVLTAMFVASQFMTKSVKKAVEEDLPGYDKFLEDSREEAFKYIEEVQQSVYEYVQEVEPIADKYSKPSSKETKAKHIEAMAKIKESTARLSAILPEED